MKIHADYPYYGMIVIKEEKGGKRKKLEMKKMKKGKPITINVVIIVIKDRQATAKNAKNTKRKVKAKKVLHVSNENHYMYM